MIVTAGNFRSYETGAKAGRLFRMLHSGLNVPALFCVMEDTQAEEVSAYVRQHFQEGTLFSVRSSAAAEDGAAFSFAGQLSTFLFVPAGQLWEKICQRIIPGRI